MPDGFRRDDRVVLEHCAYPMHDRLPNGTRGTVRKAAQGFFLGYFVDVAWDNGLTFVVLPGQGDRIRKLEPGEEQV